MLTDLSLWPVV